MTVPDLLLDQPSFQSLYLEMRNGDSTLATGTGFVVEHGGAQFLVTNRHNLRGRRQDTDEPMHGSGAIPDTVVILHNRLDHLGEWLPRVEPLYDEGGEHRWLEHPKFGGSVDVVALRLNDLEDVACYPYGFQGPTGHGATELPGPLKIGPGDFVNIIGFPFGWTAGGMLGIWVQGALASEPDLDFAEFPQFLIDSRTRPGQSGSPVVFYRRNGWVTLADQRPFMIHNTVTQLLGVYSGRLSGDSDLGTVWKTSVVADILASPG